MRADRYVEAVIAKCANLKDCGLWAPEPKVRPKAWLQNFSADEKAIAAVLLEHFVFFSSVAVDRMLLSGFRNLINEVRQHQGDPAAAQLTTEAVFIAVEGETPNPTDSGLLFCRKLRQILGLPDKKFVSPELAISHAQNGLPVIFLDDFIGSGDQFIGTWERHYLGEDSKLKSFSETYNANPFPAFYISLVGTENGIQRINSEVPGVRLAVSHSIDHTYNISAGTRNSFLPDIENISEKISALLHKHHDRLIVPHYLNAPDLRKFGYDQLGLQIAFDHSTPDATLPIFWAEAGSNWTPLVRRA